MRLRLFCALLLLSTQADATLIDSVKNLTGASVARYSKFEVGIASADLTPQNLINPYSSVDVNMYAIFTAPNGKKYRRDAFWYQPFNVTQALQIPAAQLERCAGELTGTRPENTV